MSGELPTFDRAELEQLQLERLQGTLSRVYTHVPHYTRAFDEAGVHPDDLTSLADLARFPFTTKAASGRATRSGCSPCRGSR